MELIPQTNNGPKVESSGRRSFLGALLGLSTAAVSALLAVPLVRFVTYPLRKAASDTVWSDLGPVQEFASITAPIAKTITLERRDAWQSTSSQKAVYVLPPKDGQFRILSPICPHLGCSIRWIDAEGKFICPCHTGSFTATGERIVGPPPRSMDSLESKVEGGLLKVRYQYFRQLIPNKEPMA
ncbi:QcrA and Rieske domain-containing protein [Edaphobacter bradus]|uniref:QcrA and Rieske domain-containing protein n=1 Tax=Edaphobacter bradus TaxID=2259016 RepID=UPI0021E00236|nr:ubiquinol-cytochrome c reductase iron-sulfur subunit [Edaphobacter bradus]